MSDRNTEFGPHIVISGNPVDGLHFTGPFENHDDALRYAEDYADGWWVAPLDEPIDQDEPEGVVRGLPPMPVPQDTGDEHADFHQRSALPTPSSLCARCTAKEQVDLTPFIRAEWTNYWSMIQEARQKGRDVPPDPTYASALDSWRQAPEDIQREWMPGVDPVQVELALRAHNPAEPLPEES